MANRREVLSRLMRCRQAGVPMSNYGLVIAYSLGIFQRALEPFPAALEVYHRAMAHRTHAAAPPGRADRRDAATTAAVDHL
jgi:hypothetical protein